jgi:hypothetical protein
MMDSMLHDNRHPSSDIRRKRDSFNSLGGDADRIKRFTSEGVIRCSALLIANKFR